MCIGQYRVRGLAQLGSVIKRPFTQWPVTKRPFTQWTGLQNGNDYKTAMLQNGLILEMAINPKVGLRESHFVDHYNTLYILVLVLSL